MENFRCFLRYEKLYNYCIFFLKGYIFFSEYIILLSGNCSYLDFNMTDLFYFATLFLFYVEFLFFFLQ